MQGFVGQRVEVEMTGAHHGRTGTIIKVVDDNDYQHYEVVLDGDNIPGVFLESMLTFFLSMPDPPGTTRLAIIAAKLNGDPIPTMSKRFPSA